MNMNRTIIAFPNNMEVFLPALKKKWVNYLLLSNNNKPKNIQRYELHIPDSVPNEIGEDQVILETDHIDFEGVLIGTHLKTTKTCHNGAMLFKRITMCVWLYVFKKYATHRLFLTNTS